MANPTWQISGEYCETCSCDYLCPCTPGNLGAPMTRGHCDFVFGFRIERGRYDGTALDGLGFAVVGHAPGKAMTDGNISVGVLLDERATPQQRDALTAIASGQAGGPMAALGPLVTKMLGVETGRVEFAKDGLKRSFSIGSKLDMAMEGVPGTDGREPLYLDNTIHPANRKLALAKAVRSKLNALGLNWNETSGKTNGHFAPFSWRSA